MSEIVQVDGPQSAAISTTGKPSTVIETIRSQNFKAEIQKALPPTITPDRFERVAVTALLQNPRIQRATAESVIQSLLRCAQDGLLPDGHQAALVNFRSKDGEKVQYLPMVGGYRQIAAEHGWSLRTFLVYENDDFDYELGPNPKISHKPPKLGTERGALIGVYATATHRDGRVEVLSPMTKAEIDKIRGTSRAKNDGPWVDWPELMWEKTAAKKLFKRLPLDPSDADRVRSILDADDHLGTMQTMYGSENSFNVDTSLSAPASALAEPEQVIPVATAPVVEATVVEPLSFAPESAESSVTVASTVQEPVIEADFEEVEEEAEFTPEQISKAMSAKVPSGSYQNRTLEWMLASGPKADDWLAYGLGQSWPHDKDFYEALQIVCKVHRPNVYNTWKEGK